MKSGAKDRGFALVVVLGILVLMVILVVGFLSRSLTERAAASSFKASVLSRQYADTAVSLVQGQINLATTQGAGVAWTSQPGMVRTFDDSGNLQNAYKLYSANAMIANSAGISNGKSDDEPPADWESDPGVWTDLNAPVEASSGDKVFPILDPTGAGGSLGDDADNTVALGFTVGTVPSATTFQPVPMPVRWLYILKDGTLVSPAGNGSSTTIPGESKQNPVVGRVGFWTDDDSCKVNVNTASEGAYWDTPRAASTQEMAFAQYQPAQREWQRYPGHPAMTSLSAVFPSLSTAQIYDIVPRVSGGGSNGGTAVASQPVEADNDRLYASVDELMFKPSRDDQSGLSKTQLEQAKFFLTARSRAPETNLFNLPRIACWPVFKLGSNGTPSATRTTVFDRMIAFCASTGELGASSYRPYVFQRENPNGATNDISIARNLQLYAYLRYLMGQPFPGFGGNFSAKYGDDSDEILTEIFDYIRCANLADSTLSAGNRYAPTGTVLPTRYKPGTKTTLGFGRTWTLSELSMLFIANAQADNSTTSGVDESAGSNVVTGTGTNKVLGGVALNSGERYVQAIIIPEFFAPMQGWVTVAPTIRMKIKDLGNLQIEGKTLFGSLDGENATIPMSYNIYLNGLGGPIGWRMFGQTQCSPQRGNLEADVVGSGQYAYPFISLPVKISPSGSTMHFSGATVTVEIYPGSGVMDATTLMQSISIEIPAGDFPVPEVCSTGTSGGASSDTLATDKENWWAFSRKGAVDGKPGRLAQIANRPSGVEATVRGGDFFRETYDTVRSMVPSHGDYRLVAANYEVPASLFAPHAKYSSSARMAHNLAASPVSGGGQTDGRGIGYDTSGKYIASLTYPNNLAPDIPSNATGTPEATGDFDNGLSLAPDGPLVNKPDEGNISGLSSGLIPYFTQSWTFTEGGSTFFSPNRQMPSPGMFGSLPSGVLAGKPWCTLLFRPQPSHPSDESHYSGNSKIQDHLLLDLFWMPVVEPYAISDRFSTAGKINMNYQILPFTYINRSTGMVALLKSEKVGAIPNSTVSTYKPPGVTGTNAATVSSNPNFRLSIDAGETLSQFKTKFDGGGVFKSASEICDISIVPQGQTAAQMTTFWTTNALTGDNLRERIYTTLYPRLTTKSNTFTVHFRAQSLKKLPTSADGTWTEGRDVVTGEYRGSTTIERFIDANNTSIPDYAASPTSISNLDTLDKFYRWRVIENRQFAP